MNSKLHVKASMKLGGHYGYELEFYCLIVNVLVGILEHSTAVVVHIEIVGRGENRDRWEFLGWRLAVHNVPDVCRVRVGAAIEGVNLPSILSLVPTIIPNSLFHSRD
jgi:hypothetical protein